MTPTPWLTRTGDLVVTVSIPPFVVPVEIIVWGERLFVRDPQGQYHEGLAWVATTS